MKAADYALVAYVLRTVSSCDDPHCRINLASAFACIFKERDPKFDIPLFIKAATGEDADTL